MVVAIDGPAGVGKSTLARKIAENYGFFNLNSGAFYRAVTLKIIEENIDPVDHEKVIKAAEQADIQLIDGKLYLDGKIVEDKLRTDKVDRLSSVISSIVPVRRIVNNHLRKLADRINLVAEGRDMTTVVFPDAEVKIYLDADPAVRAERRFLQGTSSKNKQEIERSIRERDEIDKNKKEGSLKIADEALVLDTSALTLEQVYEKVSRLIKTYL